MTDKSLVVESPNSSSKKSSKSSSIEIELSTPLKLFTDIIPPSEEEDIEELEISSSLFLDSRNPDPEEVEELLLPPSRQGKRK
ncbi:hypothetical protein [Mycoplasma suis]|uniref:hypothetical protein n=1 Tax=Mycoplasma suis TaxID=57372 RepID=UPI0011D08B1C|nr:hypothetical protein [Mycoplasma suis]